MDGRGNLTDASEFRSGKLIRLISYLDPDIALGVHASRPGWNFADIENSMKTCRKLVSSIAVQKVSSGDPHSTMLRASTRDPDTFSLAWETDPFIIAESNDYAGLPFVYWPGKGDSYESRGKQLALSNPMDPINQGRQMMRAGFTVDFVDGCWFALNNSEHGVVVDISGSGTEENTPIIAFAWNGGHNQIWRAQTVSYT